MSVSDIKQASRAIKQGVNALKDAGKGMALFKALFDGSNSKISNLSVVLMLGVALIIDFGQLVVGLLDAGVLSGPISLALQYGIFTLWFKLCNTSFWSGRAVASKFVTSVAKLVPYIGEFVPTAMINVVVAIGFLRVTEFAEKQDKKDSGNQGQTTSPDTKTARNNGALPGIRTPARNNPPLSRAA